MLKYEIEIVVKTIQPWSKKKALKTQRYSNLVNEIKVADVIDLRNYKYLCWESPIQKKVFTTLLYVCRSVMNASKNPWY